MMKKLKIILFLLCMPLNWCIGQNIIFNNADSTVFEKYKKRIKPEDPLLGTILFFINAPYSAGTLDQNDSECLTAHITSFDCTTFVETAMALWRSRATGTLPDFAKEIQFIRYRNGILNGYTSRLHYFSDWIADNEQKKTIQNKTEQLGCQRLQLKCNYMSSHPDKYNSLKKHPEQIEIIKQQEAEINKRPFYYIPKDKITDIEDKIHNGDIIAITSNIEGLDISHVGFACRQFGEKNIFLLHASSKAGKVIISQEPLYSYLLKNGSFSGIAVIRPMTNTATQTTK